MADLRILKQIFAMEGDSRRSLCGPRRWQGKDLVRVKRFRGLRHGTSSHAKRLYHPVGLDFSLLIHAFLLVYSQFTITVGRHIPKEHSKKVSP